MAIAKLAACLLTVAVMIGLMTSQRFAVTERTAPPMTKTDPVTMSGPAGFLGSWMATESGTLPSRLIITNIDRYSASVLYTWGNGAGDGTWLHARARVLPDGKLYWRFPGAFTFELSADEQTLTGERESGGWKATASFRRVRKI